MMSFLQLAAEKKTSFLVGISNKFRPFLFCHSFSLALNLISNYLGSCLNSHVWSLNFILLICFSPFFRFCPGNNCKLIIKAVLQVAKRVICTSCKSSFWWEYISFVRFNFEFKFCIYFLSKLHQLSSVFVSKTFSFCTRYLFRWIIFYCFYDITFNSDFDEFEKRKNFAT